jgi:hypothetical protein
MNENIDFEAEKKKTKIKNLISGIISSFFAGMEDKSEIGRNMFLNEVPKTAETIFPKSVSEITNAINEFRLSESIKKSNEEFVNDLAQKITALVSQKYSLEEIDENFNKIQDNKGHTRLVDSTDTIDNLLSYHLSDDNYHPGENIIDLHFRSQLAQDLKPIDLPKIVINSLKKLAEKIRNDETLKKREKITGGSWIVKGKENFFERLGFTVDGYNISMTIEDFLKKY